MPTSSKRLLNDERFRELSRILLMVVARWEPRRQGPLRGDVKSVDDFVRGEDETSQQKKLKFQR